MPLAKEKPHSDPTADYEQDFATWLTRQAELLRQRRFAELDVLSLVEELESMGSEQRHALESSYRLLISHLLKWQYQPKLRTTSWQVTIARERSNIEGREKRNRALKAGAASVVADVYGSAVREAVIETGLARSSFPAECPFTLEQLRDDDWLPE